MIAVIVFLLLLAGAVTLALLAQNRPQLVAAAAVFSSGLSLLLWLAGRTQLPLQINLIAGSDTLLLPDWSWQVDEPAWMVTSWLLLLLLALSLHKLFTADAERPYVFFSFLLIAFTLPALWADSVSSLLPALALMSLPWLAAVWQKTIAESRRYLAYITMLLTAVLLLLYTAVTIPVSAGWSMADWPALSVTAVLLAAAILTGIWPFFNWRLRLGQAPLPLNIFVFLMPTAVGGLLLSRTAASGQLSLAWQLLLTAMALLGYLRGVRQTWARLHLPASAVTTILFAQAQLVVLAGLWAGPTAVLRLTQVLILGGGILTLTAGQTITRRRWWQAIPPAFALAALAGLPLTAGFAGLAALYDAWLANGRFLLPFVTALLIAPLVTAVFAFYRQTQTDQEQANVAAGRETAVRLGAALVLALSLITIRGVAWGSIHFVTWAAVLLAPVLGLALTRRLPQVREAQALVRQAFTFGPTLRNTMNQIKNTAQSLGTAVHDALAILETDGGLVWVFILALLLYLVIGNQ